MKKMLANGVEITVAPGTFHMPKQDSYQPDNASISIVTDIYKRLCEVGSAGKQPVCIDFMPLSVYGVDKRSIIKQLYCTLVAPSKSEELPRVHFRVKPLAKLELDSSKNTEFMFSNILSKHIFNHSALTQIITKASTVSSVAQLSTLLNSIIDIFDQISFMSSYYISAGTTNVFGAHKLSELQSIRFLFSSVFNTEASYKKLKSTLATSSCNNDEAAEIASQIILPLYDIQALVEGLSDSVFTLALYVYEAEYASLGMLPYLNQQLVRTLTNPTKQELDTKIAQYCKETLQIVHIHELNAISINTASLNCLKLFEANTPVDLYDAMERSPQIKAVFGDLLQHYSKDGKILVDDMKAMYARHMFIANYELMQLSTHISSAFNAPASYNLLTSLTEYIQLITKFDNVPNPILDEQDSGSIWEQLSTKGTGGLLTTAVYQYSTSSRNQFEIHTSAIHSDDENCRLVSILIPCSAFDALSDKYCISPKYENFKFSQKPKDNILYTSAYLAALLMGALLCNTAHSANSPCLFTQEDSVRFAQSTFSVGSYSFNTADDKSNMPLAVAFDNVFYTCGLSIPLNRGAYSLGLSFYDMLLYKGLLAAGKPIKGIDTVKKDLNFYKWLNLNATDSLGII